MPYSQNVTFDQQIAIHDKYSGHRFLKVDPKIAAHPELGPIVAMVYAALLNHFRILTTNEDSPACQQIIDSGGWFYISQSTLSDMTGWKRQTVAKAISTMIDKLVLEKKIVVGNCTRSAYAFLDWEGELCRGSGSNVVAPHARVQNIKEESNIEDDTRGRVDEEKPKPRRVSVPKPKVSSDVDPKFIALAAEWEPKLSRSNITDKQIERAAKVLQKLVVEFGFSFKEVQQGIEYAYNDTIPGPSGFCWANHFSTLTGLCQRNTNSATNTEDIKFQKIYNSRLRSIQNDPAEIFNRRIEAIIRKFWDEPGDEEHVQRCIVDVDWFQNILEHINSERTARHKFTWHESEGFIKVVEFLIDIEANSKKTFRDIMKPYTEFLKYKLQDGTIHTLYPGHFNKTSDMFRQYLADDYNATGRKLVDWQRGDFNE